MRTKIGCERIIWPSTFEDNCSSSANNMTAKVIEYWCEASSRQQVREDTKHAETRSCLVWSTRVAWDQLKCHLRHNRNRMPSSVMAAMDHCLVEGTTYVYIIMQTQILQVTVISATRMNALQDSRTHSLQGVTILLLQITKCLDFTHDNNQYR